MYFLWLLFDVWRPNRYALLKILEQDCINNNYWSSQTNDVINANVTTHKVSVHDVVPELNIFTSVHLLISTPITIRQHILNKSSQNKRNKTINNKQ